MFRILGSKKRLCDGLTRRDLLHVGGIAGLGAGTSGFNLSNVLSWNNPVNAAESPASSGPHFGQAKATVLLFLFGSPPSHETFDPKSEAPVEIQGELRAIPSIVPGLSICEGLPLCSQIMDKVTVVRSMTHPYALHGVAYALTGMPTYSPEIEAKPRDPQHWPFIGSVVDYLERPRSGRPDPLAVPRNIALPWLMGSKATDYPPLAGPYAAFLGSQFDPVWTDFNGTGTRIVPSLSDAQTKQVRDPFGGMTADGRFRLAETNPLEGMNSARFDMRRILLKQFDESREWLERHRGIDTFSAQQQAAYSLLSGNKIREALDVNLEPQAVRDRYGMTLFGQSCLAARRLVEAGSRFVSVFWDPFEIFGGSCWDTHANHYPRLKEYLLPVFDQTFSAFMHDLDQRSLLNETAVLVLSEHGRTPQIDSKPKGAARHHWSRAYSAIVAGAGFARGKIVGKTDPTGGDVVSTPISPKDVLASTFHLLGIDPHTTVPDRLNRPVPIAGAGEVRPELFA